ncbi:AAA-ATPase ASD, mitochondrial-like [Canna indica]|uniref:AAA-ATPase ASD, mitochondrial-like n=1 Tax=Canna indica TaxID=4628 RepID=A0AAQ3Q0R8_9LILI|nr:AAA-ATPase ASD, mitochondrial-like [Canna indica]
MEMIWEKLWAGLATITTLILALPFFHSYLPNLVDYHILKFASKLFRFLNPYVEIKFPDDHGRRHFKSSDLDTVINAYLREACFTDDGACSQDFAHLRATPSYDGADVDFIMNDGEEVIIVHEGVKFWWSSHKNPPKGTCIYKYSVPEDSRYYRLIYHRRHDVFARNNYIKHVLTEGNAILDGQRKLKLFTNVRSDSRSGHCAYWSRVPFNHRTTFDMLAMDKEKKREIKQDLECFSQGQEYYESVGKPWKRGYLLYGPPGTGKSTMIAAMANFLKYDVYDLELTSVKDNTTLRQLLIETKRKSIVVIEDIDCTLQDLCIKRKKTGSEKNEDEEKTTKATIDKDDKEESKVTLSGLLNFIDGVWSSCGGERILVFTTNHKEKLDPALLRRGRMDMHIKMSYCRFEGFQMLAKNYLGIDTHRSFSEIKNLLDSVEITAADLVESLMPKSGSIKQLEEEDRNREGWRLMPKSASEISDHFINSCLDNLIKFLEEKRKSMSEKKSVDGASGCNGEITDGFKPTN